MSPHVIEITPLLEPLEGRKPPAGCDNHWKRDMAIFAQPPKM